MRQITLASHVRLLGELAQVLAQRILRHLQGQVRHRRRIIEEERPVLVRLHKRQRLLGDQVGGVLRAAVLRVAFDLLLVLGEGLLPLRVGLEESGEVPRVLGGDFVLDGDATEPAIGLASMVGKYVRELWMHRLNRYWLDAVPGTMPASGYHDPVTQRLVDATALVRREREIPDDCFAR